MFRWKLWLVIAPVAIFVLATTMASCSGGNSCFGQFNSQGQFIAGLCPTASPSPGFSLTDINICAGPPAPTQAPTSTSGPTVTPTACPQASPTAISGSGVTVSFNAQGVLEKGKNKTTFADITNAPSTVWTSNNNPPGGPLVLQPPTSGNGGVYTGLTAGCACINASSGGITGEPVSVAVATAACVACPFPTLSPTATATATPAHSPTALLLGDSGSNSAGGTVLWTFDCQAPVAGPIVSGPSESANFITGDGMLHSIDAKGKERFDRPAGGLAPAVAPDGTIFVKGTTSWVYALDAKGRVKWKVEVGPGNGPLAADNNAAYVSTGSDMAAIDAGQTLWSVPVAGQPSRGVAIPDGVAVASNGGGIVALTPNGSSLWSFSPAGGFAGDLATANGILYAGSASGAVYALDVANANVLWHASGSGPITAGPVVGASGVVYFGSDALYAIDSNGESLWSSKALTPLSRGIAALTTGAIFDAAIQDSSSQLLDINGNIQWNARDLGNVVQVNAGPSGTVFVGSSDGHVRALR
jgi:outer membrane protein assembly factor BamB